MGWIGCVRWEKFRHDFVARTFALIAPVQPVLHQVSCSNEMIPNAPKDYEMHGIMSLGSNGANRVRLFWKILTRLRAKIFAIIAPVQPVLHQVWCNNETIPNAPKHCEMHQNMSLGYNGMDWVNALRTIPTRLRETNFCINWTSPAHFAPSFMQ
jgi:hypothetical protein